MDRQLLNKLNQASKLQLIHTLKWYKHKFKRMSLNIWYLQQCKSRSLIPKFINVRISDGSASAKKSALWAEKKWLENELRRHYRCRDEVGEIVYFLHIKLTSILHGTEWEVVDAYIRSAVRIVGNRLFFKLKNKLANLRSSKYATERTPMPVFKRPLDISNSAANLSNVALSDQELSILNYGLKFAPHFVTNERCLGLIAAKTENILQHLKKKNVSYDLPGIVAAFDCNLSSKSNIIKTIPIKTLKHKIIANNLVIVKADKGNCPVILNKTQYVSKTVESLVGAGVTTVEKNPLKTYADSLKKCISSYSEVFLFFEVNYKSLIVQNVTLPSVYSLPKIHKIDIPHRPIVNFINSPAYKISKWLNLILKKHINFRSEFSIDNSVQFARIVKDIVLPQDSILLSFDVESLFPSIPIDECLVLVRSLLHESTLPNNIAQGVFNILEMTLKQNFFLFEDKIYEQKGGLTMGSPLSPILAEVFMKNLEHNYIRNNPLFKKHILTWHRFVDDVFVIFRGTTEQADEFALYLNSIHSKLKFSTEFERERSLPFLDLKLTRNTFYDKLEFEIYRKPSATHHLIPYDSSHPMQHKTAAFFSLFHRLLSVPLEREKFSRECDTILQLALSNGFPLDLVSSIFHRVYRQYTIKLLTQLPPTNRKEHTYFSLPFVPTLSYKLQKIFKSHNIKITFNTPSTLSSILSNSKQSDPWERSGVYKLTASCGKFYIGRTLRPLKVRAKEHANMLNPRFLTDLRYLKARSRFAHHCLTCSTCKEPLNFNKEILHLSNNYFDNIHLENFEISRALRLHPQEIINESTDFPVILLDQLRI